MRVDLIFYAAFWIIISGLVLTPIYVVSWAAMKKLSPCSHVSYAQNTDCSKCHGLGFIWPWKDK